MEPTKVDFVGGEPDLEDDDDDYPPQDTDDDRDGAELEH